MVGKNGHQRAAEETECEQTRGQKRSVREADCRRSDRDCINPLPDCTVLYCTVLYCTVLYRGCRSDECGLISSSGS